MSNSLCDQLLRPNILAVINSPPHGDGRTFGNLFCFCNISTDTDKRNCSIAIINNRRRRHFC